MGECVLSWEGKWQTKQVLARHPITAADIVCISCEKTLLGMNMCRPSSEIGIGLSSSQKMSFRV